MINHKGYSVDYQENNRAERYEVAFPLLYTTIMDTTMQ